jgi:putative membrane protein
MGPAEVRRVAAIDVAYGAIATLILAVGVLRVLFAAKGWAYYAANPFFWAKLASFLAMGLVSIVPTVRFIRWRRALRDDALPPPAEIAAVQRFLWLEALLFAAVVAFAATMARFS